MTCGFLIQLVFCQKKLCGLLVLKQSKRRVHPLPKKNPGSAPVNWDIKINSNESLNTSKSRIQNNAHSQLIPPFINECPFITNKRLVLNGNQFKNRLNSYRFCILNKRNSCCLGGFFSFHFQKWVVWAMENETLYGGVPYDILDCTRNLFWNLHSVTKYPQLPPQALRFPSRAVEASAKREWRVTIVFKSTHRSRHPKLSHAIWNPFLRNSSFRPLLIQFHFPSNSLFHFGSITGVLAGSRRDLELHSRVSDLGGWLTGPPNVHQLCTRPWKEVSHLRDRPLSPFLAVEPPQTATSSSLQRPFFWRTVHTFTLLQPLFNDHLSTMATCFCPHDGRPWEVQQYFPKSSITHCGPAFSPKYLRKKIYQSSTLVILPVSKPAMFSKSQSKPN